MGLVGLSVAAELLVRHFGLVDFPLYDANNTIGYIPSASQRGSFMNRNDWQINELHMGGVGKFEPGANGNLLLIGDSIVWGGNPYAAHERLGAQLQRLTQAKVWPVAAGSWGLQNELTYLRQHPEVVAKMEAVILVANSGDFEQPSSWTCETTHPREKPASALLFLLNKHVLRRPCPPEPPPGLKVPPVDPFAMLQRFTADHPRLPVRFVLYPDKPECESPELRRERLERFEPLLMAAGAASVHSLGTSALWRDCAAIYKDGIHPVPAGMQRLAQYIGKELL